MALRYQISSWSAVILAASYFCAVPEFRYHLECLLSSVLLGTSLNFLTRQPIQKLWPRFGHGWMINLLRMSHSTKSSTSSTLNTVRMKLTLWSRSG